MCGYGSEELALACAAGTAEDFPTVPSAQAPAPLLQLP